MWIIPVSGVTNQQLMQEGNPIIATTYKRQCVMEQHSIQIAWKVLMQEQFAELRACMFANKTKRDCFRKLIVNAVIATDIADKEMQAWKKSPWDKVFCHCRYRRRHSCDNEYAKNDGGDANNYKATIVFEYIIQASDEVHTTLCNIGRCISNGTRLFQERSAAYRARRANEDPAKRWFHDEIWFLDHYIISLAKKLKECGVFGVSSDEYLSYAQDNRRECEAKKEKRSWPDGCLGGETASQTTTTLIFRAAVSTPLSQCHYRLTTTTTTTKSV